MLTDKYPSIGKSLHVGLLTISALITHIQLQKSFNRALLPTEVKALAV